MLAVRDRASAGQIRREREVFGRIRATERGYAQRLRQIGQQVGVIVNGWPAGDPEALPLLEQALRRYADLIGPWAEATAKRMLAEVARREETAWMRHAQAMGAALGKEIREAPTGELLRARLAEQVHLIKSLPIDAAERVHRLTLEGIENGTRAPQIAQEILRSGEVTKSRATLIARTETSRTATELTRARAEYIGSDGYVWRTARDSDVRPSHRRMEGHFVRWDEPPTLDNLTGHAGALPNCRCYPEPVLPLD